MPNKPTARQEAIKELISTFTVSDQEALVKLLAKHHDIHTNQAAVSRDLKALGIIKTNEGYEVPTLDVTAEILKLALVDVVYNESIIVIKTYPALADFVGDYIDQQDDLDILGCLAGENVVFVTPFSTKQIKQTYAALCKKLHFKHKETSHV